MYIHYMGKKYVVWRWLYGQRLASKSHDLSFLIPGSHIMVARKNQFPQVVLTSTPTLWIVYIKHTHTKQTDMYALSKAYLSEVG